MFAGTKFKRLIPDEGPASQSPGQVKRVIFCAGKVYYELAKERKQQNLDRDVAIIRLEQVFSSSSLILKWDWHCVVISSSIIFWSPTLRSLLSRLTWSVKRWRNTATLSSSGVRRSTRTWVTMIMSDHASSQWLPTRNPFGKNVYLSSHF